MLILISNILNIITQLFFIGFGIVISIRCYKSYRKIKIQEKQLKEESKNCNLDINWFNENLPKAIETTKDIEQFDNFMSMIDEAIITNKLKYCILNMSNEDKENLKERILNLNKNYIKAKEAIYLALKQFISINQNKITERTAECFIAWYNYDHSKSNKIVEKYYRLNNILDEF